MSSMRWTALATLIACLQSVVARADEVSSNPPAESAAVDFEKPRQTASPKTREMPLVSRTEPVECRNYRPTGSHIAAVRCEAKVPDDSRRARAAREQAKNDLDEMRRRQMTQEFARQQALTNALNRLGR